MIENNRLESHVGIQEITFWNDGAVSFSRLHLEAVPKKQRVTQRAIEVTRTYRKPSALSVQRCRRLCESHVANETAVMLARPGATVYAVPLN